MIIVTWSLLNACLGHVRTMVPVSMRSMATPVYVNQGSQARNVILTLMSARVILARIMLPVQMELLRLTVNVFQVSQMRFALLILMSVRYV